MHPMASRLEVTPTKPSITAEHWLPNSHISCHHALLNGKLVVTVNVKQIEALT
jgi:hypothetical protein